MTPDGKYTDRLGDLIAEGSNVRVDLDNQPVPRGKIGRVVKLYREGDDRHGFPLIEFPTSEGKKANLPETAIRKI